ncbi:MAG: DNA cytosine methyltransferase [Opitutaceae bacterium]|nr:DNA cytosine methyltransferase [Opitutaceae bacterium]
MPLLLKVFRNKYREGADVVDFTLDDLREQAAASGLRIARNWADIIYRMRARTKLPSAILVKGFYVLRQTGRGKYRFEKAVDTIFTLPDDRVQEALDLTPLPVRRLLPLDLAEIDEQGLLSVICYCQLLDHFTGLKVYRLRSHVRKSVKNVGQAELDEVDVGVALSDEEVPVVFPIEAKAIDEAVNRVQIATMVQYCTEYFPGLQIRPVAIKLDESALIHFLEFNPTVVAADLKIIKSATYRLKMSDQQKKLFRQHSQPASPISVVNEPPSPPPTAIELFSGCGGLSTGLLDAGVQVVAGFDNDERSIQAFDYNHTYRGARGFVADLFNTSGKEVLAKAGLKKVDLLVGGPPCQPFSIAGKQGGLQDRRGNLVFEFVRLVGEINPRAVIFENVANLAKIEGGSILKAVVKGLERLGYDVRTALLNAADYGVPQNRKRLFVCGIRGKVPTFPRPTHAVTPIENLFDPIFRHVTCKEAIDDLPDVSAAEHELIHNHEATLHSPQMLEAFAALRHGERDKKSFHDRLHPDRPSFTLRAGTGNFSPLRPVHYAHDRVLTVRESARIQTFSDDFIWPDWIPRLQQYRQVGNAVPPLLARRLAEHIAKIVGWGLDPNLTKGDAKNRPSPILYTREEKERARRSRMRGASLGAVATGK